MLVRRGSLADARRRSSDRVAGPVGTCPFCNFPDGRAPLSAPPGSLDANLIAAAILAHAVVLAGVIWFARQQPAAPSALPETMIGMVFMPRDPEVMAAASHAQAAQLADAVPDLVPLALPPAPAPMEDAQPDLVDAVPAAAAAPPAPPTAPSAVREKPESPPPRVPVRRAIAAELHQTGPSPAPAMRAEVAASAGARLTAPILPPRPLGTVGGDRAPAYPEMARRRGEQGDVILRVNVDENGLPLAVIVRQSSGHPILDDAAVGAVRQWRFQPATQGGQPVVATAEIPVQFRLEN